MTTNDADPTRIDPEPDAYYLPAMPSGTLVSLLRGIPGTLDRDA